MKVFAQRGRLLAGLALLVTVAGCGVLPVPATSGDTADPAPGVYERLQVAEANCRDQLSALQVDRAYLQKSLDAHRSALDAMQLSLVGMERTLKAQLTPPPLPACENDSAQLEEKLIVGRNENVWLEDFQIALPARIDTGAETASLDARNIEEFERDGKAWVRFDILQPDTGDLVTLEREVARITRILQSSSEKAERRVVIDLGIVIGDIRQRAEFTLSDRSHLDYQILIGRNILRDLMIVDVGKVNVAPVKAAVRAKTKVSP